MLEIKKFVLPSPDQFAFYLDGMRNAYKSNNKSDSFIECEFATYIPGYGYFDLSGKVLDGDEVTFREKTDKNECLTFTECGESFYLGERDKNLLLNLSKLGTSDRKVLRQLQVGVKINASLYWWKQMDTYKVGTVANSESTMHCITNKKFELKDFSYDNLTMPATAEQPLLHCETADVFMEKTIKHLNELRKTYLETKDKWYWQKIIEFLPESYNQIRTVSLNYEVILTIITQRYNHKLSEWQILCKWFIDNIPLIKDILMEINPEILQCLYD